MTDQDEPPIEAYLDEAELEKTAPAEKPAPPPPAEGIVPLGHDKGVFYYLSRSARQVFALTPNQHTKNTLMAMASLPHYWERSAFVSEKGAVKWDEAIDHLMRAARAVGIFDPDLLRGRGAWLDDNRPVLHLGDRLLSGGETLPLSVPGSRYTYLSAKPMVVGTAAPMGTADVHWLAKICGLLRWERPVSGKLLAGWIAVAPICGALNWRPSVWITGGKGTGKSWIYEKIISACLADIPLCVQSTTTASYLRQTLGNDARPVLFDEFEQEDPQAHARAQEVLALMRQSSSAHAPAIGRGGANGVPLAYKVRSMFLFQSINISLKHSADESRVTILGLREPPKNDPAALLRFSDLEVTVAERLTPDFSAGLIARSVALIPTIRANAETFARAIAAGHGTRRLGDQIGTLLAGAYSLHSSGLITAEAATEFVCREEWDKAPDADEEKDEYRLLRLLLAYRVRLGANEMPVSRLLEGARSDDHADGLPDPRTAQKTLAEMGIKYAIRDGAEGVYISTNHPALKTALRGTPWDSAWSRALARIDGVVHAEKSVRFALGSVTRAIWVPLAVIDPG